MRQYRSGWISDVHLGTRGLGRKLHRPGGGFSRESGNRQPGRRALIGRNSCIERPRSESFSPKRPASIQSNFLQRDCERPLRIAMIASRSGSARNQVIRIGHRVKANELGEGFHPGCTGRLPRIYCESIPPSCRARRGRRGMRPRQPSRLHRNS